MDRQEISLAKTISELVKTLNSVQSQLLSVSQAVITIGEMIDQQFEVRVEEEVARRTPTHLNPESLNGSTHTDPEVC